MAETSVGERERIQILLAEYTSLRSETNSRISSSYQVVGIGTALIAWLLQQPIGARFWIGVCVILVGALYCGRVIAYDTMNAAKRVRELEIELNNRAGEKLILWESERGGLNASYWRGLFLPFRRNSN
jgi:drug/metabolite transporter (DMT)-like permease